MKKRQSRNVLPVVPSWLRNPYFWAAVIRLGAMLIFPHALRGDAVDFQRIALSLAGGHGFSRCSSEPFPPTTIRPPLFPLLLAFFYLLGVTQQYAPALLNLLLDLAAMKFGEKWAHKAGFAWYRGVPWVIALCPLLLSYGLYPTTENLSVALFFGALWMLAERKALQSGIFWGLLSLCRSYFLLFPLVILAANPFKTMKRKALVVMALSAFIPPALWTVRNALTLKRPTFSQTSTVGWQSYQGVCVANFDWWRPDHVQLIVNDPVFSAMTRTHCATEEEQAELDRLAVEKVKSCVRERPWEAVRNIFAKGISLFINWGAFLPYTLVPFFIQHVINAFACFAWFCLFTVVRHRRQLKPEVEGFLRIGFLAVGYVALVTIPFAVDSRYILGPVLLLFICGVEIAKSPRKFFRAGTKFSSF